MLKKQFWITPPLTHWNADRKNRIRECIFYGPEAAMLNNAEIQFRRYINWQD
jgi:hypothetical protein